MGTTKGHSMKGTPDTNHGWIGLTAMILSQAPKLTDAACTGRHELFDAQHPGEKHAGFMYRKTQAANICNTCPALAACQTWAASINRDRIPGHLPARPPRRSATA